MINARSCSHHHHPVACLTTGSKPPPKRSLHLLRSTASSFKWQYPLLSLRSSSSFLRLLPCLLVTSISPFIFPLITCFRRQFLRKMWPIQLAFRFLIACRIFLRSLIVSNNSSYTIRHQSSKSSYSAGGNYCAGYWLIHKSKLLSHHLKRPTHQKPLVSSRQNYKKFTTIYRSRQLIIISKTPPSPLDNIVMHFNAVHTLIQYNSDNP